MEPSAPTDLPARADAPALQPGWADKSTELLKRKPIYRRTWFIRSVVAAVVIALVAGGIAGLFLYRWHRQQQAELAGQRRSVEAFTRSAAFAAFTREADAQIIATLNFTSLRPELIGGLLPEIAAAEKSRHQVPWPLELPPVPVSASTQPARVRAAALAATDLLAGRGFTFDQARTTEARRTFLRLLTPHARTFLAENTGSAFPALFLDRRMQDIALGAYASRAGGSVADAERIFAFYALVGPSMWNELQARPGVSP